MAQIYQSIIQFDDTWLTQKSLAKILSKRCYNSQKSENTQTSEVNSNSFLEICWKHDTSVQSLGIGDSSAFYSTLSLFFGFSWTSLSIFRFEQYVRCVEKIKTVADKWRGDSNNINCNPVPVVLKKRVKLLKIAITWAQHAQKRAMNGLWVYEWPTC